MELTFSSVNVKWEMSFSVGKQLKKANPCQEAIPPAPERGHRLCSRWRWAEHCDAQPPSPALLFPFPSFQRIPHHHPLFFFSFAFAEAHLPGGLMFYTIILMAIRVPSGSSLPASIWSPSELFSLTLLCTHLSCDAFLQVVSKPPFVSSVWFSFPSGFI